MDRLYSTWGTNFKAKRISIFFVFAKFVVFSNEFPAVAYSENLKKMFEDVKITGVTL
jgi:hypothetical protein